MNTSVSSTGDGTVVAGHSIKDGGTIITEVTSHHYYPNGDNETQLLTPCAIIPFQRNPDFVGRSDILDWLSNHYAEPFARAALVGLGGIGKSNIAIHQAHEVRDSSAETWVFWVHASSRGCFEEAYRGIAKRLKLPRWNDANVNILELITDWLSDEGNGPWFMVIDNADDMEVFFPKGGKSLKSFIPRNGSILVTSRNKEVAEKLVGDYRYIRDVDAMSDDNACELLLRKFVEKPDKEQTIKLIHALGNIPLAMTQAVAFINRRAPRMTVSQYLDEFRNIPGGRIKLLNEGGTDNWRDEASSNSVVDT